MIGVGIEDFSEYFRAIHGHAPYPWQCRLAEQAINKGWPGAIDLPTGSGKTACIDIAIFALACQASLSLDERTAPRRVFFCVNRRVIVDEACRRAEGIARTVWDAERSEKNGVLARVATALRTVAGTHKDDCVPPIDVIELRGGIYRDNRWARSATQPAVICTTIDQLGSRLLFRGYGVSSGAAPIQAALIAYDSLVLLDEAHISEPFRQTLDRVGRYLDHEKWAEEGLGIRSMTVVPMTATPNEEMQHCGVIRLEDDDRDIEFLRQRLTAPKRARLREPKNKDVAAQAVEEAISAAGDAPVAVGIMVNRVATARTIYKSLQEERQKAINGGKSQVESDATTELVIGSMRPLDRDIQSDRLRTLVGPERPGTSEKTSFVVATQCLEVGADYDFDVLITECASLDALRQRFGRLNRAGRPIGAEAVILIDKEDVKEEIKLDDDKPADPIYGNALARTWNWLNEHATTNPSDDIKEKRINFGIDAFDQLLKNHGEIGRMPGKLLAPSALLNAPVILPAYVDMWCQTAPRPATDPDVSLFLHGPQRGEPDVQVCWRADLIEDDRTERGDWTAIVSLLPPTTAECMSVPIFRVRRWLVQEEGNRQNDFGDAFEVGQTEQASDDKRNIRHGVLWRGPKDSTLIRSPADLRPGDTLVLPASNTASHDLGHLPLSGHSSASDRDEAEPSEESDPIPDIAEQAFKLSRNKAALRLQPSLRDLQPRGKAFDELFRAAQGLDLPSVPEWQDLLRAAMASLDESSPEHQDLWGQLDHLAKSGLRVARYPNDVGVVLVSRGRMQSSGLFNVTADDGEDESLRTERTVPVLLDHHTKHVVSAVSATLDRLPLASLRGVYTQSAQLHDAGKADERFQAMLRGSSRSHAWLKWGDGPPQWAKSPVQRLTLAEYRQACDRAGLPPGWRHEMLSVQLAEHAAALAAQPAERELMLHLIAAHHGHARPFAPVVPDDELPGVAVEADGLGDLELTHEQRAALVPPHRLDSGVAERFWALSRRFGWWGLAYLEAVLRLADQQASAAEDAGVYEDEPAEKPAEAAT